MNREPPRLLQAVERFLSSGDLGHDGLHRPAGVMGKGLGNRTSSWFIWLRVQTLGRHVVGGCLGSLHGSGEKV